MADLLMNYEAMKEASGKVKTHKENFDEMISGMTTIIESLNGQFEGVAKTEFENAFYTLKPNLTKLATLLGQYSVELDQAVVDASQQQQASAQRIGTNLSLD